MDEAVIKIMNRGGMAGCLWRSIQTGKIIPAHADGRGRSSKSRAQAIKKPDHGDFE